MSRYYGHHLFGVSSAVAAATRGCGLCVCVNAWAFNYLYAPKLDDMPQHFQDACTTRRRLRSAIRGSKSDAST